MICFRTGKPLPPASRATSGCSWWTALREGSAPGRFPKSPSQPAHHRRLDAGRQTLSARHRKATNRPSGNISDENPVGFRERQFSNAHVIHHPVEIRQRAAGLAGIGMGRLAAFGAGGRIVLGFNQRCSALAVGKRKCGGCRCDTRRAGRAILRIIVAFLEKIAVVDAVRVLVEKHKNIRRLRNLGDLEKLRVVRIVDICSRWWKNLPASPTMAFIE
jgi:hypothetical protein